MKTKRMLYGGAITCEIPDEFEDVSDIRPVPDNQEVWANVKTDSSMIFDLLEYEADVSNSDSAMHFFNELANDNACAEGSRKILFTKELTQEQIPLFPVGTAASVIIGDQQVAKFKDDEKSGEEAKNVIRVTLVNIRLANVATDLVLSFNAPLKLGSGSSSATYGCELPDESAVEGIVLSALQSLKIEDWGLFGAEEPPTSILAMDTGGSN
jgi:hypothetical protein